MEWKEFTDDLYFKYDHLLISDGKTVCHYSVYKEQPPYFMDDGNTYAKYYIKLRDALPFIPLPQELE